MVNPGVRPSPQTSLALVLVLGVLAAGCQSAMSIDEAKKAMAFSRWTRF